MYIAIDIGGTKTQIASFGSIETGSQVDEITYPTIESFDEGIEKISKSIKEFSEEKKLEGIGVSAPSQITEDGELTLSTNIPDWNGRPLAKTLENVHKTKAKVMNDGYCAALAELEFTDLSKYSRILYLILSTGFGGAFIEKIDGKYRISQMEPGGMIVERDGREYPTCKIKGMISSYISGKPLELYLGKPLEEIDDKDPLWEEVANYLAVGINNISILLRPEIAIFSGSLIRKRPFLLDMAQQHLDTYKDFILDQPKLRLTEIKGNPSLLGALALINKQ